jgi:predicted DNA-binding transcriptional regulator AlpA
MKSKLRKSDPDFVQKSKKYLRKRGVANRYACNPRTVDRMATDGRLPPPDLRLGRFPMWSESTLDAHDRKVVMAQRAE